MQLLPQLVQLGGIEPRNINELISLLKEQKISFKIM